MISRQQVAATATASIPDPAVAAEAAAKIVRAEMGPTLAGASQQAAAAQQDAAAAQTAASSAQSQATAAQQQAATAQQQAQAAQQQGSATASAVAALDTRTAATDTRVAALDTRVTELAAQVSALAARKVHVVTGRVAVPAVALGMSRDLTITWTAPAPAAPTGTAVIFEPAGQLLGGASAAVKSVTTTGCVVTVTAAVAVALGQGWVKVIGVVLH